MVTVDRPMRQRRFQERFVAEVARLPSSPRTKVWRLPLPTPANLRFRELDDLGRDGLALASVDLPAPFVRERLVDVELLGHGEDERAVVLFRESAVELIRVRLSPEAEDFQAHELAGRQIYKSIVGGPVTRRQRNDLGFNRQLPPCDRLAK